MKKKTLIAVLLGLAAILFAYVLMTFVLGLTPVEVVPVGETASIWVKLHESFVDQYNFMIDHLAFLIVLLVFFVGLVAIWVKYLVPKKLCSKQDTRFGAKYPKKRK
jgi:NADH:ubiquinone oxidoreductase subunit 5 (subunit L)/multisubunit Na+/H+ antiporter MnhA subunit